MDGLDTKIEKKKKNISRGKMPTKRTINLATVGAKTIDKKTAFAAIVLIVAGAVIFSIYGVAGRFSKLYEALDAAAEAHSELDAAYEELAQFDMTEEEYAHYTFADMTTEELSQVEREDVLRLLDETVIGKCEVEYWSVSENILNLRIVDSTLKAVNSIMQGINEDELVSYCTVSTAQKDDGTDTGKKAVTADIVVYLNGRTTEGTSDAGETDEDKSLVETIKDFSGANTTYEEDEE